MTPTSTQILDLSLGLNDAGATTVRDYLVALLAQVWREGEGFSGKRPFGSSDWQSDFDEAFVKAGYIGRDEEGDVDPDEVNSLVMSAIGGLG